MEYCICWCWFILTAYEWLSTYICDHHLHHSALSIEIPGGFELKLCSDTCTKSFSILNLLCNLELVILIFSSLELKGIFLFFLFFKLIGHLGLLGWSEISLWQVSIGKFDLKRASLVVDFGEFGLLGTVGFVLKFVFLWLQLCAFDFQLQL